MKKILFGITSLTLGGAEKVLVDLANELSKKYDVTILTIYAKGEFEKKLNSKVKLKSIYDFQFNDMSNFKKKITALKLLLFKKHFYKKYIKGNYDIEIAFLEGPITRLFGVKNKNTRKIAWVHNDITQVFGKDIKAKLKVAIDIKTYGKYQTLVFVSKDNRDKFTEIYKDVRDEYLQPVHKRVIYNYINPQNVIEGAEEKIEDSLNDKTTTFLTVARLTKQKAIDRIIRVHKKLIDNNFMHEFYVIGDGPERENLEKLIQELNVTNTFHLLGKKENPYPYMKQAQFFCLLSEFEGYGMVIEEAKILNKPIIITDTAAREAVQNYENSIIVNNNEEGIYAEIKEVLQKKIKSFSNKQEKYDNSKIITKLEKLLEEEVKTINI